jgi:hypothetical protein
LYNQKKSRIQNMTRDANQKEGKKFKGDMVMWGISIKKDS